MSNYPTVRPSLTLDFQKSKQLDPRISFSRASGATYLNPDTGLITLASEHEARFEKDGLLIEESRTNKTHPSNFTSASVASSWTILNDTYIIPDQILSPSGESTGALLDFDTANT